MSTHVGVGVKTTVTGGKVTVTETGVAMQGTGGAEIKTVT